MIPALWICKTGLDSQQTNISVTSNNLANASTVGYKKSRAIFEQENANLTNLHPIRHDFAFFATQHTEKSFCSNYNYLVNLNFSGVC